MEKRQELILGMIRKKVMQQVGLHRQDITASITPISNPYNNSLDDLEDIDDTKGSISSYSSLFRARTLAVQGQSLAGQGGNSVKVHRYQNEVGYYT